MTELQEYVDYVRALNEVIQQCYHPLSPSEESLENMVRVRVRQGKTVSFKSCSLAGQKSSRRKRKRGGSLALLPLPPSCFPPGSLVLQGRRWGVGVSMKPAAAADSCLAPSPGGGPLVQEPSGFMAGSVIIGWVTTAAAAVPASSARGTLEPFRQSLLSLSPSSWTPGMPSCTSSGRSPTSLSHAG